MCLSPGAGLGGGDAKRWEIGQPWASGVTDTVPSPSAGASFPSPPLLLFLGLHSLSLLPSLSLPLSLLWPPSPQFPLQVFTLQLSSDSISSVSLPFPFPFSPPPGDQGVLVGG